MVSVKKSKLKKVLIIIIIAILIGVTYPAVMFIKNSFVDTVNVLNKHVNDALDNMDEINSGNSSGSTNGPGLYQTGSNYTVLLKPWSELLDEGIVCIVDDVLYTQYDSCTKRQYQ